MKRLLLFGGTGETRALLRALEPLRLETTLSVATSYGRALLSSGYPGLTVRTGRLDHHGIRALIREERFFCVIDATHPYAAAATENIRAAAAAEGCPYLRFLRAQSLYGDAVVVPTAQEAAAYLNGTAGNVLLTTGSKELEVFTAVSDYRARLFVRVLHPHTPESVGACLDLGFPVDHIIAMQGPFSKELNVALMRQLEIGTLVTKDGGIPGGFPEKQEAAGELNAALVVIGRAREDGLALRDITARVRALLEEYQ